MSEDKKKTLNEQAVEAGKKMYESYAAEKEAADKAAVEAKKKAKQVSEKKVTHVIGAFDAELGVSKTVWDNQIDKIFDVDRIKGLMGMQKDEEKINEKNALFIRATVGMKLFAHDPRFASTVKALSEGTDADGGFLVNPEFKGEVARQLHNNGIFRKEVNVQPTTKDSVLFNKEDGRPLVSWGSENTAINTTTAGLAQVTINVHRMNTIIYLSREVVADSDPSIIAWINGELVDSVKNEEDAVIVGGSGTGRPNGLTQITWGSTRAAGTTFDFTDWVDLEHLLPVQYRQGAESGNVKFYMNDNSLRDTRGFTDDQSRPIYERPLEVGGPSTLMGWPVIVSNQIPDGTVFFGNLKRSYTLLDRQQMSIETTIEGGDTFSKHQLGMKLTERIGGDSIRQEALVEGSGYNT